MAPPGFLRLAAFAVALFFHTRAELRADDAKPVPAKGGPPKLDDRGDPLPEGAVARIGTVKGPDDLVHSIAFSPDGLELAAAGPDHRIHVWDPRTGKQLRAFGEHSRSVNAIAYSPDGTSLVSGGQDAEVIIWQAATGEEFFRLEGGLLAVASVAFSPDGQLVVAGDKYDTVCVWDVATGEELQRFHEKSTNYVRTVAFSADGKTLAVTYANHRVELWNTSTWQPCGTLEGHKERVTVLAFSPNGRMLFTGAYDTTVRFWDVAERREVLCLGAAQEEVNVVQHPPILSLAAASDGKTVVAGRFDGVVIVWDTATGKELRRWLAHSTPVTGLAFAPDGKTLASVSRNRIRFWEPETGKGRDRFEEAPSRPQKILFSPDGRVLVVGDDRQAVRIIDASSLKERACVELPDLWLWSLAISPDSRLVAFVEAPFALKPSESRIRLLETATGKERDVFKKQPGIIEHVLFWPDGNGLLGSCDEVFTRWDPATGKELKRWQSPGSHTAGVTFSPCGHILARAGMDNHNWPETVSLWSVNTGKKLGGFGLADWPGYHTVLKFSPDGKSLASRCSDGPYRASKDMTDVTLWETATGQVRCRLKNKHPYNVMDFSPDGSLIATSDESTIRLWDAATAEQIGQLTGHRSWVEALAFSPDGRVLVSGSADSTMLFWDPWTMIAKPKPATDKLTGDRLDDLWADLKHDDAPRAYKAIGTLARHPDQSVPFLHRSNFPSPAPDPMLIAGLIADLDDESFAVREKASAELARAGFRAGPALQRALEGKPSTEARRRLKELTDQLAERASGADKVRMIRVVETLERIGTADAQKLLQDLAAGGEWSQADEAKLALERLARRAAVSAR